MYLTSQCSSQVRSMRRETLSSLSTATKRSCRTLDSSAWLELNSSQEASSSKDQAFIEMAVAIMRQLVWTGLLNIGLFILPLFSVASASSLSVGHSRGSWRVVPAGMSLMSTIGLSGLGKARGARLSASTWVSRAADWKLLSLLADGRRP